MKKKVKINPRFSLAENKAKDILKKSGSFDTPVDIGKIVDYLKIKVNRDTEIKEDILGASIIKNGKKHILINKSIINNEVKSRFTIAHEIGHLEIHQDRTINLGEENGYRVLFHDKDSFKSTDFREVEANHFAMCLLIPNETIKGKIKSIINNGIITDENINELSNEFKVSVPIMMLRLLKLGYLQY